MVPLILTLLVEFICCEYVDVGLSMRDVFAAVVMIGVPAVPSTRNAVVATLVMVGFVIVVNEAPISNLLMPPTLFVMKLGALIIKSFVNVLSPSMLSVRLPVL